MGATCLNRVAAGLFCVLASQPVLGTWDVGNSESSCGHESQGLTPVNCTEHGDRAAYCVYSNHCGCSSGYVCNGQSYWGEAYGPGECAAGVTCIAADAVAGSPTPAPDPSDWLLPGQ